MLRALTVNCLRSNFRKAAGIQFPKRMISASTSVKGIDIQTKDNVLWLKLNRPDKLNSISLEMYLALTENLEQANKDENVKAVVLTGTGDYYSSGTDLSNFIESSKHPDGPAAGLLEAKNILIRFVDSFINLEKFITVAVNGPAIGIAVTTMALSDYVIASDKATFSTPFTALGLCPEACSSYTFREMMGLSKSSEFLLMNKTFSAKQAQNYGLVSQVIEAEKFHAALHDLLAGKLGLSSFYPNSLKVSKALVRTEEYKANLKHINRVEAEVLYNCWVGEECQDATMKFLMKSKK